MNRRKVLIYGATAVAMWALVCLFLPRPVPSSHTFVTPPDFQRKVG